MYYLPEAAGRLESQTSLALGRQSPPTAELK